jgi:hypothetical protein
VIPGGCIATDPSNCNDLRGGFFEVNASSTWEVNTANLSSNIYPLLIDQQLGYSANGELGFDDVTLGWQGAGGPALRNQTVAGFEDKDFYLGFFGLTPRASNFTSFDDPIPSYMQNLRTENLIPSTSWSYTAGNQYRKNISGEAIQLESDTLQDSMKYWEALFLGVMILLNSFLTTCHFLLAT